MAFDWADYEEEECELTPEEEENRLRCRELFTKKQVKSAMKSMRRHIGNHEYRYAKEIVEEIVVCHHTNLRLMESLYQDFVNVPYYSVATMLYEHVIDHEDNKDVTSNSTIGHNQIHVGQYRKAMASFKGFLETVDHEWWLSERMRPTPTQPGVITLVYMRYAYAMYAETAALMRDFETAGTVVDEAIDHGYFNPRVPELDELSTAKSNDPDKIDVAIRSRTTDIEIWSRFSRAHILADIGLGKKSDKFARKACAKAAKAVKKTLGVENPLIWTCDFVRPYPLELYRSGQIPAPTSVYNPEDQEERWKTHAAGSDRGGWAQFDSNFKDESPWPKLEEGDGGVRDGSTYCDFDRVSVNDLTSDDFLNKYALAGKPVIIDGLFDDWPALRKWTYESFLKTYGKRKVDVMRSSDVQDHFRDRDFTERTNMRVKEFLEKLLNNEDKGIDDKMYLLGESLGKMTRKDWIAPDYLHLFISSPEELIPLFYLGAPGSSYYLHAHASVFNMLVFGQKRWMLIPPDGLYGMKNTEPDVIMTNFTRAELDALPIRPLECVQRSGETMFIPQKWAHAIVNEKISIGLSMDVGPLKTNLDRISRR